VECLGAHRKRRRGGVFEVNKSKETTVGTPPIGKWETVIAHLATVPKATHNIRQEIYHHGRIVAEKKDRSKERMWNDKKQRKLPLLPQAQSNRRGNGGGEGARDPPANQKKIDGLSTGPRTTQEMVTRKGREQKEKSHGKGRGGRPGMVDCERAGRTWKKGEGN